MGSIDAQPDPSHRAINTSILCCGHLLWCIDCCPVCSFSKLEVFRKAQQLGNTFSFQRKICRLAEEAYLISTKHYEPLAASGGKKTLQNKAALSCEFNLAPVKAQLPCSKLSFEEQCTLPLIIKKFRVGSPWLECNPRSPRRMARHLPTTWACISAPNGNKAKPNKAKVHLWKKKPHPHRTTHSKKKLWQLISHTRQIWSPNNSQAFVLGSCGKVNAFEFCQPGKNIWKKRSKMKEFRESMFAGHIGLRTRVEVRERCTTSTEDLPTRHDFEKMEHGKKWKEK